MGKGPNDFLKAVANAGKSKGLQKLRFYCQACLNPSPSTLHRNLYFLDPKPKHLNPKTLNRKP
jgi:hypothetical protein